MQIDTSQNKTMPDFNQINYYENELNVETILQKIDIQQQDEALDICDLSDVIGKYQIWLKHLPRVKPFYAVKCNNDLMILSLLAKLGINFDCASKNEIKQILEMSVSPDRIIFANPCKPISHLDYAKAMGINSVTVDNEFEIYKLFRSYPQSKLLIRFRSEAQEAQCPLGDKFGCDAENDALALILLAQSLELNVIGTSFHVGSGCTDNSAYDRAIKLAKNIFNFGDLLEMKNMNVLDIGGGFPGNDNESFVKISKTINTALEKYFPNPKIDVIAEPGRFFVASSYTLSCKIHGKREVRLSGKLNTTMYYINDGVYGSFNCILYDHQKVTASEASSSDTTKFNSLIWGPTCDALDKILESSPLPNLTYGDLIIFPNMGAYTIPIASPFNGFMLPKTLYFINRIHSNYINAY